MPRQVQLPGYNKRLKTFRERFAQLLRQTDLYEYQYEHLVPSLDADRIKYWKFVGAPTQEALTLLSQVFRVPADYLWPPMPDDGAELDRDRIRQDLRRLQNKAQKGLLSPEEHERYRVLLDLEKRLSGSGPIAFSFGPIPKLVCVLPRLPLRVEDLPEWDDVWEGGAIVLPMDGVKPTDPVYAFRIPTRLWEFEARTLVVFRPLYVEPEPRHIVIGVWRGAPHIAEGRDFPKGAVPLGRVIMSVREH